MAPEKKQTLHTIRIGDELFDVTGRKRNKHGYVLLCIKDHPNSDSQGYIFEHRIVKEIIEGRFMRNDEVVHHKNHIKHDNRASNLEILDRGSHAKLHHIGSKRNAETRERMSAKMHERLEDRTNHPNYKNIDKELIILIEQGYKASYIARKLGITRKTVYNKIAYLKLEDKYYDK